MWFDDPQPEKKKISTFSLGRTPIKKPVSKWKQQAIKWKKCVSSMIRAVLGTNMSRDRYSSSAREQYPMKWETDVLKMTLLL